MQKSNAKSMMFNYSLLKKNSWMTYYLQFITLETQGVDFSLKNIEDLEDAILYLELAFLWP